MQDGYFTCEAAIVGHRFVCGHAPSIPYYIYKVGAKNSLRADL